MQSSYPYENIQIGNFLLSIGYYLHELEVDCPSPLPLPQPPPPLTINLYQQIRGMDSEVGDLFGGLMGNFFIIEFKRDVKLLQTELEKPNRRKLLRILQESDKERKTSEKAHYICYPERFGDNNEGFDYLLDPYTIIQDPNPSLRKRIRGIRNFVKKLSIGSLGVSYDEIRQYLTFLSKCSESSHFNVSGIVVNFDKDGGLKYLEFNGIQSLEQNLKLSIDLQIEKSKRIERSQRKGMGF